MAEPASAPFSKARRFTACSPFSLLIAPSQSFTQRVDGRCALRLRLHLLDGASFPERSLWHESVERERASGMARIGRRRRRDGEVG
jgi:hypothetical protein